MRKTLNFTKSLFAGVFGEKNNLRGQRRGASALSGDTEFFFKIAMDISDRFYDEILLHSNGIIPLFLTIVKKGLEKSILAVEKLLIFFVVYIII